MADSSPGESPRPAHLAAFPLRPQAAGGTRVLSGVQFPGALLPPRPRSPDATERGGRSRQRSVGRAPGCGLGPRGGGGGAPPAGRPPVFVNKVSLEPATPPSHLRRWQPLQSQQSRAFPWRPDGLQSPVPLPAAPERDVADSGLRTPQAVGAAASAPATVSGRLISVYVQTRFLIPDRLRVSVV